MLKTVVTVPSKGVDTLLHISKPSDGLCGSSDHIKCSIINNDFNKRLLNIIELCQQGKFSAAQKLSENNAHKFEIDGVIDGPYDFTAPNLLTPHPVYGWMAWVSAVNPSRELWDNRIQTLLRESYRIVLKKYSKKFGPAL